MTAPPRVHPSAIVGMEIRRTILSQQWEEVEAVMPNGRVAAAAYYRDAAAGQDPEGDGEHVRIEAWLGHLCGRADGAAGMAAILGYIHGRWTAATESATESATE